MIYEDDLAHQSACLQPGRPTFSADPLVNRRSEPVRVDAETQMPGHGSEDIASVKRCTDRRTPEGRLGKSDHRRLESACPFQFGPAAVIRHQQPKIAKLHVQ